MNRPYHICTGGSKTTVFLCPLSIHRLEGPIIFTSHDQVLTTLGEPKDSTRAELIVEGADQATAIKYVYGLWVILDATLILCIAFAFLEPIVGRARMSRSNHWSLTATGLRCFGSHMGMRWLKWETLRDKSLRIVGYWNHGEFSSKVKPSEQHKVSG